LIGGKDATLNLAKLFEDMVGAEDIIRKLHKWQQMARIRKAKGMYLQMIPTNFISKGPPSVSSYAFWIVASRGLIRVPGVGKTTVA
jgi:hypothetical protein